jgi:hypothetical protein
MLMSASGATTVEYVLCLREGGGASFGSLLPLVGCSPIWLLPLVGCFLWQQVLLVAEAASAFRARRRTWLCSHAWPQTTCTGLHPVHYATI